ncbi:MAG: hypothetical protein OEM48_08610 [Gammaproteobacteria bacterium]|nr:hypothetical protein [Gammaproteobacteria bacterium]MDH3370346.1 hypothetical protein [Gammaproteobacteria bacterium]MDH3406969.1 hypothetical protein [Gammaproteobacteria bacterium]MDH5488204.1 hypothetical protein [Gammaproteobacteria bacterium]
MKLWRMMLISLCVLLSACASTRDFYEAVYNTLQLHAEVNNLPDNAPFLNRPVSFQQYEAERETLLNSQGKSTKSPPEF